MVDREKVILGLEHCSEDGCKGCPYEPDCNMCDGFSVLADDALELLKEQEPMHELIVHCKDCEYGLYTGTEYCCDKHSGHENRLGEDQYYKEWHNGSWFCADGKKAVKQDA